MERRPQILAHRGQWRTPGDKNSLLALRAAIEAGFGIETDVRDRGSDLVVSHDPPDSKAPLLWEFLEIYAGHKADSTLALNIKSDGLGPTLAKLLSSYCVRNYFVFDMSIPETLRYERSGAPFYTRQSELEQAPMLYDSAGGVWLDAFQSDWWNAQTVAGHLAKGKSVAVVSPELHGRDPEAAWRKLGEIPPLERGELLLCTDRPIEAGRYFGAN